jgi:short-subunit dehydrogenase
MRLAATVLPDLHAGGGIAFVASVAGYRGLPKALAYGPGKAALIHFAECLHLDLAPQGIGVWVINPGFVATQLTAQNDFAMPALLTPSRRHWPRSTACARAASRSTFRGVSPAS